ncbi:MAG: hypothetical protein ACTTJS_00340 [Wolinella sp.]
MVYISFALFFQNSSFGDFSKKELLRISYAGIFGNLSRGANRLRYSRHGNL